MSKQPESAAERWCCSPVTGEPLSVERARRLVAVFKALGDPVRLRLLSLIATRDGGEACACDLSGAFELSASTISHHLKVLREAGLIDSERRGTWVLFSAVPDSLRQLSLVLGLAMSTARPS